MRRQVFLFVTLLALVATPPAAIAQSQFTTGDITGTVKDNTGGVLPGATVTLSGPAILAAQIFVTGPLGAYRFAGLPPAKYDVTYEMDGFAHPASPPFVGYETFRKDWY